MTMTSDRATRPQANCAPAVAAPGSGRSRQAPDTGRPRCPGEGRPGRRIVLLDSGDDDEPSFLQVIEAQKSVLAPYRGGSQYASLGERVVAGQHVMQPKATSSSAGRARPAPTRLIVTPTCGSSGSPRPSSGWSRPAWPSRRVCAAVPSPVRTPGPMTASRWPRTPADPPASATRSPNSPRLHRPGRFSAMPHSVPPPAMVPSNTPPISNRAQALHSQDIGTRIVGREEGKRHDHGQ